MCKFVDMECGNLLTWHALENIVDAWVEDWLCWLYDIVLV